MSDVQEFTVESLKADRAAWPQLPGPFISVHPSDVDWGEAGSSRRTHERVGISRLLMAAEGLESAHLVVARDQVTGIPIPTDARGRTTP